MFSHVTERYFTTSHGVEFTSRLCEGAMLAIHECGLAVMENGQDYAARANLMWAAVIAHNGVLGTGRNQEWSTHMMGAPISGQYGSVHGGTISVLLPIWMEYVCPKAPEIFARFAARVFSVPYDEANLPGTAQKGIEALRVFINQLGLPTTLCQLGVKDISFNAFPYLSFSRQGGLAMKPLYHIGFDNSHRARYAILPGDPGRVENIARFLDNPRFHCQNRLHALTRPAGAMQS